MCVHSLSRLQRFVMLLLNLKLTWRNPLFDTVEPLWDKLKSVLSMCTVILSNYSRARPMFVLIVQVCSNGGAAAPPTGYHQDLVNEILRPH